nr:MAG TPA: hypothetical protein [Bacteriophage sp.]
MICSLEQKGIEILRILGILGELYSMMVILQYQAIL